MSISSKYHRCEYCKHRYSYGPKPRWYYCVLNWDKVREKHRDIGGTEFNSRIDEFFPAVKWTHVCLDFEPK